MKKENRRDPKSDKLSPFEPSKKQKKNLLRSPLRLLPLFLVLFQCLFLSEAKAWGFFTHKRINRVAVFLLPPEMLGFYKAHIQFLTENAVNPDRRRYAVEGEAPRHYIDLDVYGERAYEIVPHKWKDAVEKYSEDTLLAYGIVPWHIEKMVYRLTEAMRNRDSDRILLLSADLGHYIGDGNVPLHTTVNYNGHLTGQSGIHGFWESRLPELFFEEYDLFFDSGAEYESDPLERAWAAVTKAHIALDSVFRFERELTQEMGEDQKWSFETRGNITTKVYAVPFSRAYHDRLNGQVERQIRASIKMTADLWYTCWVNAGKPDLKSLIPRGFSPEVEKEIEEEMKLWREKKIKSREHEGSSYAPTFFERPAPLPVPNDPILPLLNNRTKFAVIFYDKKQLMCA
jgi:hypothetical protein